MDSPHPILNHPLIARYAGLVRADLRSTYSRNLHKWLLIAPLIGLTVGLFIIALSEVMLVHLWPVVLGLYQAHPWVMIPGLLAGFIFAGWVMQRFTPNPDEHSTEEVIASYHHHQGDIQGRYFVPKILSAIASVGLGGSAALEGPSIYGGGAIASSFWAPLRRFPSLRLSPEDRRILLISGAAAGMAAVFRAPLTGIVFALEMPYKDDLAHQALLPSLLASVVAYATMATFIGAEPLFEFAPVAVEAYTRLDLLWSAVLGAGTGLIAMTYAITFRRFRRACVRSRLPHWVKMARGGLLTALTGLGFVAIFPGDIIPIGLNYEAATAILAHTHTTAFLVGFAIFKLAATLFSLGSGGVSAMFVPLFLSGGALGIAFAQSVIGSPALGLYAAVGMASFIAAGYKAPLTAVVFIAEAAGGHAYIIPALIGAAVAYTISGEASASGDQRLHERFKENDLSQLSVRDLMDERVSPVADMAPLAALAARLPRSPAASLYPVVHGAHLVGSLSDRSIVAVPPAQWATTRARDVMDPPAPCIAPEASGAEALRRLSKPNSPSLLWVSAPDGPIEGLVTQSALLRALTTRDPSVVPPAPASRSVYAPLPPPEAPSMSLGRAIVSMMSRRPSSERAERP